MKYQILLVALTVAALSSCTTAYKTGQTPDDVYFSPAREQDEYVQVNRNERRYHNRDEYYDDRYLRMRMNNRLRWSELDDWYYYGGRYDYSYYNSFYWNNPWSPCSYWNNYYNPYYNSYVIVKPQSTVFNRPRTVNLNTYNNNLLTNNNYSNPKSPGSGGIRNTGSSGNSNSSVSSGRGSNSNSGNFLRNIFNNNNSSSGNSSGSSGTSGGNSGGSSSGKSSGSSGSSAPVRRF